MCMRMCVACTESLKCVHLKNVQALRACVGRCTKDQLQLNTLLSNVLWIFLLQVIHFWTYPSMMDMSNLAESMS